MNTKKMIKELTALGAFVFMGDDGSVKMSAEEGDGLADYYGEFTGFDPWVDPRVEKIVTRNGGFVEWDNPGCLSIWRDQIWDQVKFGIK
jgi:hypothetical protein